MSKRGSFEFQDNSKEVKRQIRNTGVAAMTKAAGIVENNIKPLVPVDTGGTRDHISHVVTDKGSEVLARIGSPHKHAIYLEFGTGEFAENGAGRKGGWVYKGPDGKFYFTRGMRPRPFIRPGFRMSKSAIQKTVGDEYGVTFRGG